VRIGFVAQGSTDMAFLTGLAARWCEGAEPVEIRFSGTRFTYRRDIPEACWNAMLKGCDVLVILADSDGADLNAAHKHLRSFVPEKADHFVMTAIAVRNVECWICADADQVASKLSCDASDFQVPDPKAAFERAMGITRDDKKKGEIASLVCGYPSLKPMLDLPSFNRLYNDARRFAKSNGCEIPNERSRRRAS
jgi:hypothetical protein